MSKRPISPDEELARQEYPEALNFEGLERRINYRIIAYREDILHILDRKDAAAIVYHIVYRWLEHKRDEILKEMEHNKKTGQRPLTDEEIEQRMWIYMSYNDFARETGGGISYNTVIATLNYLINAKNVLERRENHDPRFSDYEYRINKKEVTKLLAALPISPPTYTKSGTGKGLKVSTKSGIASTNIGTASTNVGTTPLPDLGHITEVAQITSQNFSQEQQKSDDPLESEQTATAARNTFDFENLTEEEIALLLAYRQGSLQVHLQLSENLGGGEVEQPSKQAERIIQADEQSAVEMVPAEVPVASFPSAGIIPPDEAPAVTTGSDGLVPFVRPAAVETAEEVVQLWEYVRKTRYGERERVAQLRAATVLLGMELPKPRTPDLLETLYTTYYDKKWKELFGELHVAHLVGVEKSSGQVRIVRWINRLDSQLLLTPAGKSSGAVSGETPPTTRPKMDFANYPQEERDPVQEYLEGTLDTSRYPPKMLEVLERHAAERRAVLAKGGNA